MKQIILSIAAAVLLASCRSASVPAAGTMSDLEKNPIVTVTMTESSPGDWKGTVDKKTVKVRAKESKIRWDFVGGPAGATYKIVFVDSAPDPDCEGSICNSKIMEYPGFFDKWDRDPDHKEKKNRRRIFYDISVTGAGVSPVTIDPWVVIEK